MFGPAVNLEWVRRSDADRSGRRIVVFFHGWCGFRILWKPFLDHLAQDPSFDNFDIVACRYHSTVTANLSVVEIVDVAMSLLDSNSIGEYESITVVGFSIGGLLARLLWLTANGESGLSRRPSKADWASRITHIVLLASPNQGSTVPNRTWWGSLLLSLGELFGFGKQIRGCVKGAGVVTNLRIDWIRATANKKRALPLVTQVLAMDDTWVQESESSDVTLRPNGRQERTGSGGHAALLRFKGKHAETYQIVKRCILGDQDRRAFEDTVENGGKQLVMLRHGIRTEAQWIESVQRMSSEHPSFNPVGGGTTQEPRVEIDRRRYGWFTAFQFAMPWSRSRKLAVFCDQYTEHLARHPHAHFHFVGHSFGTWLLGAALRSCPSMRFRAVVVIGSVLEATFPWRDLRLRGQIAALRSDCASDDVPVGIVCCVLEQTPLVAGHLFPHLGTGGSEGFVDEDDWIRSNRYLEGDHSVGVSNAENLRSVVNWVGTWIAGGEAKPEAPPLSLVSTRPGIFARFTRVAGAVLPGAFVILAAASIATGWMWGWPWGLGVAAVTTLVVFIGLELL